MKHKVNVVKSIFQIKYKPVLSFYDKLFEKEKIFNHFPHWQTDRMKVNLRDFNKKHSLTIMHDSVTYESDKYVRKNENEVVSLVAEHFEEITNIDSIKRFGHRYFCLVPLELNFEELVKILNLKLLSRSFFDALGKEPNDSTLTVTSEHGELEYRIQIGPMRNTEVPNFIKFNIENHIDVKSEKKYTELAQLLENYPDTSLYIDLDLYKQPDENERDIKLFHETSSAAFSEITINLTNYIFEDKLK